MYTKQIVSAVTAIGLVSGVAAVGCKDDPVMITSQADATQIADCEIISHDVVFGTQVGPDIDFGGSLSEIQGNLIIKDNGFLHTLKSSSLRTIGGSFQMNNVTTLATLTLDQLNEVGEIDWVAVAHLDKPSFGTLGITKAKSITISDTFISVLTGISVEELTDMDINNNKRLTTFSTNNLKSLSNVMRMNDNGPMLTLTMPNLEWIANMTIANVSSFSAPALHTVNGSMRFDSNSFTSLLAPNLTEIQDGDLSFVSNGNLKNISMPHLKNIGGGFTVANNTQLAQIDGFSSLKSVGGAVLMRGSFTDIELPAITNVFGTAEFVSTADISKSCQTLEGLSGNVVQGRVTACRGLDLTANNGTDSVSGDSGSSGNGKSAASLASVSMSTVFTLAALGGLVATFL